jgi:hypothetical protein
MDEDSATLLATETWSTVEKVLPTATDADLKAVQRAACAAAWQELLDQNTVPQTPVHTKDRQVEGVPMVLQVANSGRILQNSMRRTGKKESRNVYVQAVVCAGIKQTMERPLVLAWKHQLTSDHPGQWDIPSDWIFPIKYNQTRSYMIETARVVYDHAGFVLCGSEMPLIELKRDKSLTSQGITCYTFLFVLRYLEETEALDFEEQALTKLEWQTHRHEPSGKDVQVPLLPGPFGDAEYKMDIRVQQGFVQHKQLGAPAGCSQLWWFFADENDGEAQSQ